jgi:serine/threonine-protein kinase
MTERVSSPLSTQLAAAIEVILANGWSDPTRVEKARLQLATALDPVPTAGRSKLAQYLVDQDVLSREQAQDLDLILRSQANLPGFTLLKKIGSGGMGVVFLARHLASGRECALKTLNTRLAEESDFVDRFHREAKALAGLQHRNIAEVLESGEIDGHCFLAMEYVDGPSAMTLLRDYRAIPEIYALRVIKQVSEGLAYVYQRAKLVHRDIKPENILIMRVPSTSGDLFPEEDIAKIIDFGLVKSMKEDDQRLTQTGMTIGTPLYMSPEQVRGESLDCRSDIYGLGATLYHLLTGSTPFTGNSPGSIMSAHLTEPVPDPSSKVPSLSDATRRIVMTAMAKTAGERFLTHEALIGACSEAITALAGKGDGAPRLLRKPLVLKTTAAVRKSEREPTPPAPGLPTLPPSAGGEPVSSRIIAKHRGQNGSDGKIETGATHKLSRGVNGSGTTSAPLPSNAAAETEPLVMRPHLPHPAAPEPRHDAALEAEARAAAGESVRMGMLPWVVLAVAVAGLAAYLVLR